MVTAKLAPVGFVLGILFFELGVSLFLAAQADLFPEVVLLLCLPHQEHQLSGLWAKPLGVQTCSDQRHEEQKHLEDEKGKLATR